MYILEMSRCFRASTGPLKVGFEKHCFAPQARMDEIKENVGHLRKTQGPVALGSLQAALTEHVEDMNRRLKAGLAVRQTQTAFEVLGLGRTNALLRISLTKENNIHYAQFVKRQNEMQSGVIYVRASQDGTPAILFSDFPRPNVQVSYQEASKRLLDCSF
jgi:hypothetical protein